MHTHLYLTRSKALPVLMLLSSVALNAAGQVLFKAARSAHLEASIVELAMQPVFLVGLMCYGLSAVSWLWVLSRAQLSFAYPILALSFPIVVWLSALLFAETISPVRWMGVAGIVLGVALLART